MRRLGPPCRATLGALSACAALAFPRNSAAQDAAPPALPPLIVQRAPDASDCPDAAGLAARVQALTGRAALSPAQVAGPSFAFEVQILKSDQGYVAILLAAGKSRQLDDPGPGCSSLADALALTLAILVDSEAPPQAPAPPPPPAPVVTPPPIVLPAPRPPIVVTPQGPRLLVSVEVGATVGLSGDAAFALELGSELRVIGPLSIRAGFTWTPGQSFPLPPGSVDVQLMFGHLGPCVSSWAALGRSRVGGCVELGVGALQGRGVGFFQTREATRPWAAVALSGLLDVPLVGPLCWSSRLSAVGVLTQEVFTIDGVGTAFEAAPLGLSVTTGVGLKML